MTPGPLPPSWSVAPLAALGEWRGGGTPAKDVAAFWTGGTISWVSPKDMKQLTIRDTEDRITREAVEASATNVVGAGSVLIVTRSGILRRILPVAVNEVPVAINQDLKALELYDGIDPRYVAWALRRFEREILHDCVKGGTTVQSVVFPKLLQFEIPIAPAAEQRRIVAAIEEYFSRIDAGVEALQRARRNLHRMQATVLHGAVTGRLVPQDAGDEPAQVLLKQIGENRRPKPALVSKDPTPTGTQRQAVDLPPTWTWTSVGQLARQIQYGYTAKAKEAGDGPRFLRITDIQKGQVDWSRVPFCLIPTEEIDKYRLELGDVLFARSGATTGKTYLVGDCPDAVFASYLIRLKLMPRVSTEFVHLFFQTGLYWNQVISGRRGMAQPNVNAQILASIVLPLPPAAEQERIVHEVARRFSIMDALNRALSTELQRAGSLRQAILSQAFRGQLVPQDPSDESASVLLDRIKALRAADVPKPHRPRRRSRR